MESTIKKLEEEIDSFDQRLDLIKVEELSRIAILELNKQIDKFSIDFNALHERANKALAIAWNTNRLDLIESFSKVKDSCQKYTAYGIGEPKTLRAAATGLYGKLDQSLFAVFGDPKDPSDLEALKETEPAMEALVKFSVWYLKDYWEMGLLPSVTNQEDLDLNMEQHTETERAAYREKLFNEVKKNLQKIGLFSVSDLKKAHIFSKKTLHEYIEENLKSVK